MFEQGETGAAGVRLSDMVVPPELYGDLVTVPPGSQLWMCIGPLIETEIEGEGQVLTVSCLEEDEAGKSFQTMFVESFVRACMDQTVGLCYLTQDDGMSAAETPLWMGSGDQGAYWQPVGSQIGYFTKREAALIRLFKSKWLWIPFTVLASIAGFIYWAATYESNQQGKSSESGIFLFAFGLVGAYSLGQWIASSQVKSSQKRVGELHTRLHHLYHQRLSDLMSGQSG